MRFCLLLLIFVTSEGPTPTPGVANKPPQQQTTPSQKQPNADQRGTEQSPLVVKMLPTMKTKEETDQQTQDRETKSSSDRWTVRFTGALTLIAFLQLLVYGYQAKKLRETVKSAEAQSLAMERHISEAARSAQATETIASSIEYGNKITMRAYVTTTIGGAVYQERNREGQPDLKFEGKANIINTGATPARRVRIQKTAAILPNPIPDDFAFPLPEDDSEKSGFAAIGPRQSYIASYVIDDFVADEDVGPIKRGHGKNLCFWGRITYEDVFGDTHHTDFAHQLLWLPDGQVFGYYLPGHNDAD